MKKKLGIGSSALLLLLFAIVWSANIEWLNNFCLGDTVLKILGLPAWSGGTFGTHYTIFYSIIFLLPSILIGYKFPEHLFAKAGKIASSVLLIIGIIMCLFLI